MEHFQNAKVVRLRSHHGKYLTADGDEEEAVRQHRSAASSGVEWEVELVEGSVDVIRLKSCSFNRYLAASDKRFLLGATGRKVVLLPQAPNEWPQRLGESIEWQPVGHGTKCIKLQSKAGTFLRANGLVKPYGNTVTHDNPRFTQDWVLWEVEVIDSSVAAPDDVAALPSSTCSSFRATSARVPVASTMEYFRNAKVVRLLSRHDKYLTAEDDAKDSVRQHRSGAPLGAHWEVELVEGKRDAVRLKNCRFNRYLAASEERFLLGATGRKVVLLPLAPNEQPESLGESVEWQPVGHGTKCVKLQTKAGTFLRANGLVKPYGNTVTHDNPHLTPDWILWEVEVTEMAHSTTTAADGVVAPSSPYPAGALTPSQINDQPQASVSGAYSPRSVSPTSDVPASCLSQEEDVGCTPSHGAVIESLAASLSTGKITATAMPQSYADSSSMEYSARFSVPDSSSRRRIPSPDSSPSNKIPSPGSSPSGEIPMTPYSRIVSPLPHVGRLVHYYFADDDGGVNYSLESGSFEFHGCTWQEVIHSVEKETERDDFILCRRNVISGKLHRVSLNAPLPPGRSPMAVFIVDHKSTVAKHISK